MRWITIASISLRAIEDLVRLPGTTFRWQPLVPQNVM